MFKWQSSKRLATNCLKCPRLISAIVDLSCLRCSYIFILLIFQVKEQQQLLNKEAGQLYCIDTEAFNSGVPYADSFTVITHICAYKESPTTCRLVAKAEIVFRKELWGFLKEKIGKLAIWRRRCEFFFLIQRVGRRTVKRRGVGVSKNQKWLIFFYYLSYRANIYIFEKPLKNGCTFWTEILLCTLTIKDRGIMFLLN